MCGLTFTSFLRFGDFFRFLPKYLQQRRLHEWKIIAFFVSNLFCMMTSMVNIYFYSLHPCTKYFEINTHYTQVKKTETHNAFQCMVSKTKYFLCYNWGSHQKADVKSITITLLDVKPSVKIAPVIFFIFDWQVFFKPLTSDVRRTLALNCSFGLLPTHSPPVILLRLLTFKAKNVRFSN